MAVEGVEGPHSNVLKIRPPLVFDENHARQFPDTLALCETRNEVVVTVARVV